MSTWLIPRDELTPEQLRAIELDPQQHQMIVGAPGSGKTQILPHRARYLCDRWNVKPESFQLFVYTNVLKTYIRSAVQLLNLPQNCVTTFDDWCRTFYQQHVAGRPPWDSYSKQPDFAAIRAGVEQIVDSGRVKLPLFEFVLVDEAQDLEPMVFHILSRISRHLTVCFDSKQQIFEQGSSESEILEHLGLSKRNLTLLDAYRCSPYIARVAAQLIADSTEQSQYLRQVRTEQAERQTPLLFRADSFISEKKRLIEALRERQFKDQRIGVLFPLKRQVYGFAQGLRELGLEVETQEKGELNFGSSRPKLITYASAKGLTFDSVLLPRLVSESFPMMSSERICRLLFVAITRATHWVYFSTTLGKELPELMPILPLETERVLTVQTAGAPAETVLREEPPKPKPAAQALDFL